MATTSPASDEPEATIAAPVSDEHQAVLANAVRDDTEYYDDPPLADA